MGILGTIKSASFGIVIPPIILVGIQVIARLLELYTIGFIMTLYKGQPIFVPTVILWLLFVDSEIYTHSNLIGVILAWVISYAIIGDWIRKIPDILGSFILVYLFHIYYLVGIHRIQLIAPFPQFIFPVLIGISSSTIVILFRTKRRKTFFERLHEKKIPYDERYSIDLKLPVTCPKCGTKVYSNPKYCWNCGENLEETIYSKIITKAG